MNTFIRILIVLGTLGLAAILGAFVFRGRIAEAAYTRAVSQNFGQDTLADLPDGLHVYMCGAGSPFADPHRAGPCVAILAGSRAFVFDAGSGGARNMTRMGFPMARIERVFLTHLHSDHIDGLGELFLPVWVTGGRAEPLPVAGPAGVEEVVAGFSAAYRIDASYRTAHHGPEIANPAGQGGVGKPIEMPAGPGGQVVLIDEDGLKITAFRVNHSPAEPAFGYRVDYKDRSIALSGDTVYDANLVSVAAGVDILFHEALNREMLAVMQAAAEANGQPILAKVFSDIPDYHATPADAGRAAAATDAGALVFYHPVPPLPSQSLDGMFAQAARLHYDGDMSVARDGRIYSLPTGSRAIIEKQRFR